MSLAYSKNTRCQIISEERKEKWVLSIEISQQAQLPTKGPWHSADFKSLFVYKLLLRGLVLPAIHQQESCPPADHIWTSFPHQQDREDGAYPSLVMLWGWKAAWLGIWNNLQVKHWGHMVVSVCPTWASPITSFSPSFDSSPEGRDGWMGSGVRDHSLNKPSLHKSSLSYMLSQTVMEGQRKVKIHLCPDKRVD